MELARTQHEQYRQALRKLGFQTELLPADDHPDSCFVEDMAVVLPPAGPGEPGAIVLTRSPVRAQEQPAVEAALRRSLPNFPVFRIAGPGLLEGGDVLLLGSTYFVGLSSRTNRQGYEQFRQIAAGLGYQTGAVPVSGRLHLKTGVTAVDSGTVLAVGEWAGTFQQMGFRVLQVSDADWHAANVVAHQGAVVLPSGHPAVSRALTSNGFQPVEVGLSCFKQQDGGATCLSILFES